MPEAEKQQKSVVAKEEPLQPTQDAPETEVEDNAPVVEGGQVATQDVLGAWSAIRGEVKLRRTQAEALLNSQRLLQVKNGVLILGFPSDVLKSKMENPENIEVTRRVIQNLLNVDMPIQCVVVNEKGGLAAGANESEPNGLVDAAINLGGKLVHKD